MIKFLTISLVVLATGQELTGQDKEQSIRLPLPKRIQKEFPWMIDEPISSIDVGVVGGLNETNGQAKHQIALFRNGLFICGGSFISSRTVLTAAHCIYGYENTPSKFTVRYNTLNRTTGPTLSINKIYRHEKYSSSTLDYDVATLILSKAFTPGANADVISMTLKEPEDDSELKVTGWGLPSSGGTLPTQLQAAKVTKISKLACSQRWGSINPITSRMLCTHDKTSSSCNGDSGGPLTMSGLLVGVVSWGPSSCLHNNYPNVYANVAKLRKWIKSKTV